MDKAMPYFMEQDFKQTQSVCTKHTHYLNNSHFSGIYSQYFIQKVYCIIQFINYLFNNEAVFVCVQFL